VVGQWLALPNIQGELHYVVKKGIVVVRSSELKGNYYVVTIVLLELLKI
jgi:hypothetical protein